MNESLEGRLMEEWTNQSLPRSKERPTMFYAHLKQDGGCDYTIACGEKLVELDAVTWEQAEAELRAWLGEHQSHYLDSAELLHVSSARDFDMPAYYRELAVQEAAEKRQQEEAGERAEFERLQKKFGGKS